MNYRTNNSGPRDISITVKKRRTVNSISFRDYTWYSDHRLISNEITAERLCRQRCKQYQKPVVIKCTNLTTNETIISNFESQEAFFARYGDLLTTDSNYRFKELSWNSLSMNCNCILKVPVIDTDDNDQIDNLISAFQKIFKECLKTLLKRNYNPQKLSYRLVTTPSHQPNVTSFLHVLIVYPISFSSDKEQNKFWRYVRYYLKTLYKQDHQQARDHLMYLDTDDDTNSIVRHDVIIPSGSLGRNDFEIHSVDDCLVHSTKTSYHVPHVFEIIDPNEISSGVPATLNKRALFQALRSEKIAIDDDELINNRMMVYGCDCKIDGSGHYFEFEAQQYLSLSYDGSLLYKCTAERCSNRSLVLATSLFTDSLDRAARNYPPVDIDLAKDQAETWFGLVEMGQNDQYYSAIAVYNEMLKRDDGLSEIFADIYKDRIIFTEKGEQTYLWNGKIWKLDKSFVLPKLITRTLRPILWKALMFYNEQANDIDDKKSPEYKALQKSINTFVQMMDQVNKGLNHQIIKSLCTKFFDERFLSKQNHHPYKLISKNGMIDLRTGRLIDALPSDNLTLETEYEYFPCSCPLGECGNQPGQRCDSELDLSFVENVFFTQMKNDIELYNHLRWVIGYILVGDPKKKLAFIGYGLKYNGKSLTSNLLLEIFPMYIRGMDKSVVIKSRLEKGPGAASPEYVFLMGARGAILNETGENAFIDEEQVKAITGRDRKNVRQLRGTSFDMLLEFAPWIMTNFKPKLSLTDPAMWQRICPVLFPVSFLPDPDPNDPTHRKADEDLKTKMYMTINLNRVFNWAVRCCLYYVQNQDKEFPDVIKQEIQDYMRECNIVVEFLYENKESYAIEVEAETDYRRFSESLSDWCKKRSMRLPTRKKLVEMLKHAKCEIKNDRIVGLKHTVPSLVTTENNFF